MRRSGSMRRLALTILLITLLMGSVVHGQSLGDVARQNREKQKAKDASSTPKPKVITNENLPKNPDAAPAQSEPKTTPSTKAPAGGQSAEQYKTQILAQKNAIASLQAQIDALNKSIYFVEANAYYNGVQYNEYQVKKQKQVAQMQQQLEEQEKRLAEMQEAARQAGMGNAIYDP